MHEEAPLVSSLSLDDVPHLLSNFLTSPPVSGWIRSARCVTLTVSGESLLSLTFRYCIRESGELLGGLTVSTRPASRQHPPAWQTSEECQLQASLELTGQTTNISMEQTDLWELLPLLAGSCSVVVLYFTLQLR